MCVNDVRSHILWYSCMCPGWPTLLSNLLVTSSESPQPELVKAHPWMANYFAGKSSKVCGFKCPPELLGLTFRETVLKLYAEKGICTFGIQDNGHVLLAPLYDEQYKCTEDSILFALGPITNEAIRGAVTATDSTWHDLFKRNRRSVASKVSMDGLDKVFLRTASSASLTSTGPMGFLNSTDAGYGYTSMGDGSEAYLSQSPSGTARSMTRDMTHEVSKEISPVRQSSLPGRKIRSEDLKERAVLRPVKRDSAKAQMEHLETLRNRATTIRRRGAKDPFVVLLELSDYFGQIKSFLEGSRMEHIPRHIPIVVITPGVPEPEMVEMMLNDDKLALIVGDPGFARDLVLAGVQECNAICCLGMPTNPLASQPREEGDNFDADIVMVMRVMEHLNVADKQVTLELRKTDNISLLPDIIMSQANGEVMTLDSHAIAAACASSKSDFYDADAQYVTDPRYAAGQVFIPRTLGSLMAWAYRVPGIMEAMEGLICSSGDLAGSSYVWTIAMRPEWIGKTYSRLFTDLVTHAEVGGLPLGILRSFTADQENPSSKGYVWTHPDKDTVLFKSDQIFVLADRELGATAEEANDLVMGGCLSTGSCYGHDSARSNHSDKGL